MLMLAYACSLNLNQSSNGEWKPVKITLPLPGSSILLKRSGLMERLNTYLSSKEEITTVALVGVLGMGGVGKTTFARLWAAEQMHGNGKISVWEFNAETEGTLQNSLKEFSNRLAQTTHQKAELQSIEEIRDPTEREYKRLGFVQSVLKDSEGWVF